MSAFDEDFSGDDQVATEFGIESSGGATSELKSISTSSVVGATSGAASSEPLDVSEILRETSAVTSKRATELIQLDAGNLTVYNTQEFEPQSIA